MSLTNITAARPDFIGCYDIGTVRHFYGVKTAELDRAAFTCSRVLRTFGFIEGTHILTISMVPEIVQYAPLERGIQMLGIYGLNADESPFDAGRVASIARQFAPVAICGVAKSTLDGLAMLGVDARTVFEGRVVWARPDCYEAVRALGGCDARRIASIGPMLAIECAHGGLHYDSRDWELSVAGGRLMLSSRLPRVEPLDQLDTGVEGTLPDHPCRCGIRDALVALA